MDIISYSLFESKKYRKFNDLLRNLGVMDDSGNIKLSDMTERINQFLSKDGNKDKFLKDYDKIKDKVDVKSDKVDIKDLIPSQNTIYLDHVLSRIVVKDGERKDIIKGKLKDNNILISSDDHIIDGHHRWAAALVLNPDCKLHCTRIEIPIELALPIINAILDAYEKESELKEFKYSTNIFDIKSWPKKKLLKKMNSIIGKAIDNGVDLSGDEKIKSDKDWKTKTNESLAGINTDVSKLFYKHLKKKLDLNKHPLKYMRKNMKKIPSCKFRKVDREDMPQIKKKHAKKLL